MEKSKQHSYSTRRNKVAQFEENENPGKKSPALSRIKNVESAEVAKYIIISGYASPPCRQPNTFSQQSESEVVWDLTSPSARKYQVMLSDKKTSTPNQTPTRKRELRPHIARCKKNIVLAEDKNNDVVNELAMLNDLLNKQAQTIMTPPRSAKGSVIDSCELLIDKNKSVIQESLNTSDAFGNDSFFSESVLLSTQALEEEAIGCNPTPSKKMKNESIITPSSSPTNNSTIFVFNQPSPENVTRRSFDLDSEEIIPNKSLDNFVSPKSVTTKLPVAIDQRAIPLASQSRTLQNSTACANQSSSSKVGKPSTYNLTEKIIPKPQVNEVKPTYRGGTSIPSRSNLTSQYASANRNSLVCPDSSRSQKSTLSVQVKQFSGISHGIGITRLVNDPVNNKKPVHQTNFVAPPEKVKSLDPFDDDDDDLLCAMSAVAEEVESQYIAPVTCKTELDDDDDFQPDVLAFISQIETQAIQTVKSTAELLEEKRQAAIRKREQRLMSRR